MLNDIIRLFCGWFFSYFFPVCSPTVIFNMPGRQVNFIPPPTFVVWCFLFFVSRWKLRKIGVTNLINYKWLHFFCLASIQRIPIQRVSEVWSVYVCACVSGWVFVCVLWQLKRKGQWIFSLEVLANYHVDGKFSKWASGMGNEPFWTLGDVRISKCVWCSKELWVSQKCDSKCILHSLIYILNKYIYFMCTPLSLVPSNVWSKKQQLNVWNICVSAEPKALLVPHIPMALVYFSNASKW